MTANYDQRSSFVLDGQICTVLCYRAHCNVTMNWSDFFLQDNMPQKHFKMKPCMRLLFFLSGKRRHIKRGTLKFYDTALSLLGTDCQNNFRPSRARYDSKGLLKYSKNTKETFNLLRRYLDEKKSEGQFDINLETSNSIYGISDRAFEFTHDESVGNGFISLMLPVDYFDKDYTQLVSLSHELASPLPIFSGYTGFSLNIAFADQGVRLYKEVAVNKLSRKYLGVDFRLPSDVADIEHPRSSWQSIVGRMTNVSWITYASNDLMKGKSSKLSRGISVKAFDSFSAIQIDNRPSLLSSKDRGALSRYQEVASFLQKPDDETPVFSLECVGGEFNTNRWLRRFLLKSK